nr:homeobox protein SIX3-like [Aegilops tauschii subsp. strangulata]
MGDQVGEGGGRHCSGGHSGGGGRGNGGARGGGGAAVSGAGPAASGAATAPAEPAAEEATGDVEVEPVAGVAAPAGVTGGVPTGSTSWEGAGDPRARSDSTSVDEVRTLQSRIRSLIEKDIDLVNVIQVMLVRRTLPC